MRKDRPHRPPPHRKDRNAGRPRPSGAGDLDGLHLIYGLHSVREALANPGRTFRSLLVTENALARLTEGGQALPIQPEIVRPDVIGRQLTPDAVHQGMLLIAEPPPAPPLDALPRGSLIIALDQVTDPHNVGAILRSACAFGVSAVITPVRHSPEVTGVLAKAASGALEHVPIIAVRNLVRTLEELGERGLLRVGLDSDAPVDLGEAQLALPMVLVLGAEGKGLRQSTRAACDILARIDLPGAIRSLNVSNAAAVSLYAIRRRLDRPRG
ncbi:MAG TPA: RNA methyltransferase [Beijerinckiaceae bacterium]|nr:RNA methyltransferase [Beijerinckiaceae bacterium]